MSETNKAAKRVNISETFFSAATQTRQPKVSAFENKPVWARKRDSQKVLNSEIHSCKSETNMTAESVIFSRNKLVCAGQTRPPNMSDF